VHCHLNDFESGLFDENGNPEIIQPRRMFSLKDFFKFLQLLDNAQNNNLPLDEVFGSMYSSSGNFTLRFQGNIVPPLSSYNSYLLEIEYNQFFEKYSNKERAMLHFIENAVGLEGVSLFKIRNDGVIKKKIFKRER